MRLQLIAIGLLLASSAPAQRGGGGGGRGGRGGDGMSIPVNPARKNYLEQFTDDLALSKEQKKDVKTLMDEAQKEAAPIKDQLTKSRAQVAAAVESGNQDDVDKAIKSHSELEAQMTAVEMKAFAGIYKVLDSDQRQKSRTVFVLMPGIFGKKNWVDAE